MFYHKEDNEYIVSERRTGTKISSGKNIEKSIGGAKNVINFMNPEYFGKAIDRCVKDVGAKKINKIRKEVRLMNKRRKK